MRIIKNYKFIFFIASLLIAECCLVSYIGWWRSPFWDSVANKQIDVFLEYLIYFSLAALTLCFTSSKLEYCQTMFALKLRSELTHRCITNKNILYSRIEGHEQRIQEDCLTYPRLLINLIVGGAKNIVILLVCSYLFYIQLGIGYFYIPFMYALIGTFIASYIAKPLILINYCNQRAEAFFRKNITTANYLTVFDLNVSLAKRTKLLAYFQYFYNQITVIIPYLILAVPYFSGKIVFGVFMQCSALVTQITENLSYIVNSFNDINKFISCRKRLKELGVI